MFKTTFLKCLFSTEYSTPLKFQSQPWVNIKRDKPFIRLIGFSNIVLLTNTRKPKFICNVWNLICSRRTPVSLLENVQALDRPATWGSFCTLCTCYSSKIDQQFTKAQGFFQILWFFLLSKSQILKVFWAEPKTPKANHELV